MTYFNTISHAIDRIGNETFKNDEISIHLPGDACFFLRELDGRDWFTNPGIGFRNIIDPTRHIPGLCSTGVIGLKFKKTDLNSTDDQVKPEFLETLKKASLAYLTALASDWKVCTNQEVNMTKNSNRNYPQDTKGIVRKGPESEYKMGAVHCILYEIAKAWGLDKKIDFSCGYYVLGKWEYLKQFHEILKIEASGETLLSLSTKICRQISYNPPAYLNQEKYKYLPNDLLEKIQAEAATCLKN